MNVLVECRDLECRLGGEEALRGISFQLNGGESLAVVGPSGSGKSTLLRALAGLEVPTRGQVMLGGQVASAATRIAIAPHRRRVAMLFQDAALWPNLSVGDNISLGLAGQRLTREETNVRTLDALNRCGIADLQERHPRTLSGGQQQRVALARALAARPKLLLLDEPFGGLDLLTRDSVAQQVRSLKSELGFTLVLVTHDPWEIELLCEVLVVLENGQIAERGTLSQIVARPQTLLARALVERW